MHEVIYMGFTEQSLIRLRIYANKNGFVDVNDFVTEIVESAREYNRNRVLQGRLERIKEICEEKI